MVNQGLRKVQYELNNLLKLDDGKTAISKHILDIFLALYDRIELIPFALFQTS